MMPRVFALASSVVLAGCSVVGVREAEEPHYDVVGRAGQVEIRQYPPRIAAEATVDGSEMQARSTGFRRLAGYIFGANSTSASVAMTAPVAQSRTIAMTAPVAQSRQDGGGWTIRFFMPAKYTMGTLPRPNDAAVKLVQVPAETMAVLRFSGSTAPQAVAEHGKLLMDAVATSAWTATGCPVAWFYDPPWTLPPFRRNEVAVPVVAKASPPAAPVPQC